MCQYINNVVPDFACVKMCVTNITISYLKRNVEANLVLRRTEGCVVQCGK